MANTDVPYFSVRAFPEGVKGSPVDLTEKILEFEFEDEESKADRLTLKISNEDLSEFDNPIWRKGVILEATWGYVGNVAPTRRCVIRKIGGARQLTVEAHALSMLMHTQKKSRVFKNMTMEEIAKKIALDYSDVISNDRLSSQQSGDAATINVPAEYDQRLERRVQAAETDASFLARLAKKHGLVFYVDNQGIHFKQRNMRQVPVKVITWYGGDGDDAEFVDFGVDNDITAKPGAVTKKGFDPLGKKTITHRADNSSTSRDGLAPVIEVVDARTGSTHLATRASEEHEEHTNEVTPNGVKSHAAGKFRENQHVTVHLTCEIVGDPSVLAKRIVELKGLGKRLSGRYYVQAATHTIGTGYKVKFKCKTDGTGGYSSLNVKSDANKNTGDPTNKPVAIEVIDPRTGGTHIEYRKGGEEK